MLSKDKIIKRFGCEVVDVKAITMIQTLGFKHGQTGAVFTAEEFDDEVGMDITHVESILFADAGSVRKVYDDAVREGQAFAKKLARGKKKAA